MQELQRLLAEAKTPAPPPPPQVIVQEDTTRITQLEAQLASTRREMDELKLSLELARQSSVALMARTAEEAAQRVVADARLGALTGELERALRNVQQARDEAHRFAVTFSRARRKARTVTSRLLELPGIGPTRRRTLLSAFGSLDGIRGASPEAIAALPGMLLGSVSLKVSSLATSPCLIVR